ncbi:unnamed protein product [Alopecurus aequalis]
MDENSRNQCSEDEYALFSKRMTGLMFRGDALLVVNTILMVVIAGIGAYGHRYRHHPLIRFLYLGATTLFLPIVSYIVSTLENPYTLTVYTEGDRAMTARCQAMNHVFLVLLWIGLVQIVGTNATAIVAGDSREGRSIAPPLVQLVQAIWTSYLAYISIESGLNPSGYIKWSGDSVLAPVGFLMLALPYALILAKLLFKYFAWYKAGRSLALGRNPRLIVGYMDQLQCGEYHADHGVPPPPLIVTRENTLIVEKQPNGYSLAAMNTNSLVTIEGVWQLDDALFPRPAEKQKDLCLSFALFKLLRCRFASILYCLFAIIDLGTNFSDPETFSSEKIFCTQVNCHPESSLAYDHLMSFGRLYYDIVPLFLLAALAVLVEVREIASYICSNWTKVALICHYVKHTSWQQSLTVRKCIGYVLRTRCRLLDHWEDKMNQCSVLVLYPWRNPVGLLRRLLHLPDQKKKIPRAVKAAVVNAVRRYDQRRMRRPSNGRATPLPIQLGSDLLWTFHAAKGVADAMLVCHVATGILEARSSNHKKPLSDHEVVATQLSRYCAYLVACSPELLPDDALWCRSLYKAVNKDAARVLSRGCTWPSMAPEAKDQRLVRLLSARSKHQVLKDGAELGARLAQLAQGGEEDVAWKALAAFWSETVVSVAASSDNMDEHAEAIARGGELVTILWALLAHLRSVDDDDDAAVATHGAAPPPDV